MVSKQIAGSSGAQLGEWGGRGCEGRRPPLPFFENKKKCPYFEKQALILSIFGLSFPFKMYFKSIQERNSNIFSCGAFLLCFYCVYLSALILQILPCPDKRLVAHLKFNKKHSANVKHFVLDLRMLGIQHTGRNIFNSATSISI